MKNVSSVNLIFIHGKPGCGKDTQVDMLLPLIPHSKKISGVYRSAFTMKGEFSKYNACVKPFILPLGEGINIPGEILVKILSEIVADNIALGFTNIFICGFPRTIDHIVKIESWLEQNQNINYFHIYLDLSDEESLHRARNRYVNATDKRIDDQDKLIMARLKRYKERTIKMIDLLRKKGRLTEVSALTDTDTIHNSLVNICLKRDIAVNVSEQQEIKQRKHNWI